MAIIRVRKDWKDYTEGKPHATVSRRDFLKKGLFTGTMSVALPHALSMALAKNALAGTTCQVAGPQKNPGALAQIYRNGGPTVGAMFLNKSQIGLSNFASNYGVNKSTISQIGSNYWLATSSPFYAGLANPPLGYTQTAWLALLSGNTSMTGHYGPFHADDGAGFNSGLLGSGTPFKPSQIGMDLRIFNSASLAPWSLGAPSTQVNKADRSITPSDLSANFQLAPSTANATNLFSYSGTAMQSLSGLLSSYFLNGRSGGPALIANAQAGFMGDQIFANSAFGSCLFDVTSLPKSLQGSAGSLSNPEQALLMAYYQSALGTLGGVFIQQVDQDYHQQDPATVIAPGDYEAGRMVGLFFAACAAAGQKGAMIVLQNGQAIAKGTSNVSFNDPFSGNGMGPVDCPVAISDAGGTYNAGFILGYDPNSAPPFSDPTNWGTFDSNGAFTNTPLNSPVAVGSLYVTAFKFLGLNYSNAQTVMANAGVIVPNNLILI